MDQHLRHQLRMCLVWRLHMQIARETHDSQGWAVARARLRLLQEGFHRTLLYRRVIGPHDWDTHVRTFDLIEESQANCLEWRKQIEHIRQDDRARRDRRRPDNDGRVASPLGRKNWAPRAHAPRRRV
jgi:hypothetical protein